MKIKEIIGEAKLTPRISNKSTSGVLQSPNLKFIAAGTQAIAYYHKTHPNTVVKVAAVSGEDDPIWQFLRLCINNQKNPYFPKIFNYKIFNLKSLTAEEEDYLEDNPAFEYLPIYNNRKMQILMVTELLQEMESDQFASVLKQIGVLDYINSMKSYVQRERRVRYDITTEFTWVSLMDKPEERRMIREHATDKNFKDAMRLLEPLFSHKRFYADVHLGNMMLRQDGHLVFNDPLANTITDN